MGLLADILGFIAHQETNRLQQEEWETKKEQMQLAMKQQKMITDSLEKSVQSGIITREQAADILLNPKGLGGTLYSLAQWSVPNKSQVPSPTANVTQYPGQQFGISEPMVSQNPLQPNLVSQMTTNQLGFTPQELAQGEIAKQFGMANPAERVGTGKRIDPKDNQWKEFDINKYGNPIGEGRPIPPNWKLETTDTALGPAQVWIDTENKTIDWNSIMIQGMPISRERMAGGPTGVQNIPVPTKMYPGMNPERWGFAEPVKQEFVTEETPSGATVRKQINPYGVWTTPTQAIPGKGIGGVQGGGGIVKQPEMMLPIKMDDLTKWIHAKNLSHPQPGTSPQQATKEGFKLVTTQAATDLENIKNMEQPIKELGILMPKVFGPESEAKKGGWVGEKAQGWSRYLEGLVQTDINAADYKRLADSTLSIWARGISAEKGNLNEGDVKRASGLIGGLTDRPEIAWRSYRRLQLFVKAIKERKINGIYDDSPTPLPGEKSERQVVRTGTFKGKKVVEYDNGEIEYAK
jgi:hypothetical protein